MPAINSYEDSICRHEAIFTKKFTDLGFKSDVYINTDDLKDYADYPLMLYAKELVKNRRCPIFKRKTFFNIYEEFMDISCGQTAMELYDYLQEETSYDVNMVWDNLLRTANMYDIKQRMQLNYILPSEITKPREKAKPKVALFMHIYYVDMIEHCKNYADNMPLYADIFITTNSEEKKTEIEKHFADFGGRKVTVVLVENRGREYAGNYIGLKPYYNDYEYICIAHGKKSLYDKPYMIGESFSYHCFENTLGSREYVENILTCFEENPRLGLLVPPTPNHGPYYSTIGREWKSNYCKTKEFAEMLGLKANIDPSKPPVAPLGDFFWQRTAALKKLFMNEFKYEDFPEEPCAERDGTFMHALERIYPFVAQDAGYYSAWAINDRYCRTEITNLYKIIRDINEGFFWVYGESDRHTLLSRIYTDLMSIPSEGKTFTVRERFKIVLKMILGEKFYTKLVRIIRNRN
jgi:rhamnosyltransferase